MTAVSGHAVDGDACAAELRPADAAMLAPPAALVVMVHHTLADEGRIDPSADRGDHATRLVPGDDGPAAAKPERGGGIAGCAVRVQIAAAHPGRLHLEDDLARTGGRVGKVLELELAIAEEYDAAHGSLLGLEARPYHARPVR